MFRTLIGWFCLLAGAVFLTVNSVILWRGAAKWAHDDVEWYAWGIVAALVPWAIAIMPALITETWRRVWVLKLPSAATMTVLAVWVVFIAYNIVNGAGAIGTQRAEKLADKAHAAETLDATRQRRAQLLKELSFIPEHRPREAVERLIAAEKANRRWQSTAECSQDATTAKASREFCDGFRRLEAELASAKAAEKLTASLAEIDVRIASSSPVTTGGIDPQTEIIADVTSMDQAKIRRWLPAATPIVLEIGAATMWHFGFTIMGIGLGKRKDVPVAVLEPEPEHNPAPLMSPEAIRRPTQQIAPLSKLTAQRLLCEAFFKTCTRHAPGAGELEAKWFGLYAEVCMRSNDVPLPIESFRRIAANFIPTISDLDGSVYYRDVLPVIPSDGTV